MPEPTKYDKEKPTTDPNAPLTSAELLGMKTRYQDNPAIRKMINEALLRRIDTHV